MKADIPRRLNPLRGRRGHPRSSRSMPLLKRNKKKRLKECKVAKKKGFQLGACRLGLVKEGEVGV